MGNKTVTIYFENMVLGQLVREIYCHNYCVNIITEANMQQWDVTDYDGETIGWLRLVFGNGASIISDYSSNAATEQLVKPIFDIVNEYE